MKAKLISAIALAVLLPVAASAHRTWLLPSATAVSGNEPWVTVDAAVSSELFYYDHRAMRLEDLTVVAPDGSLVEPQNKTEGRQRAGFDLQLTRPGTYRIASAGLSVFATYTMGGEEKRWRGNVDEMATAIPSEAENLEITESFRRVETFVTSGAPTNPKPIGKGLELVYETHPNDLYAGETAKFRLVMNGKGVPEARVAIAAGGSRYTGDHKEIKVTTDKKGAFEVTWAGPGMYWLNAEYEDAKPSLKKASKRAASYTVTLEVLPQ